MATISLLTEQRAAAIYIYEKYRVVWYNVGPSTPRKDAPSFRLSARRNCLRSSLRLNQASNAKRGPAPHKEMDPLTADELYRFLDASSDDPLYPVWLTLFLTDAGQPLAPRFVQRKFAQALAQAGSRQHKLHNTGHTYATTLFSQGEHPKVVQEQMGHSCIAP